MTASGKSLSNNARGVLWMIGAAVAFTVLIVGVRELSANFSTFEILFFRSFFTTVVMLFWMWRAGPGILRSPRRGLHLLRACVTYTAMLFWFYAIGIVPLADAVAVQFTYPLFTILLAAMFLDDRPGPRRWIATLVGFGGMLIIVRPGIIEFGLPIMILLGSAVLYAVSNAVTKVISRTDSADSIVFSLNVMMVPMSLIPAAFVWVWPAPADLPWILLLGLSGITAHMCLARAVALGDISTVMPFDFLRLPFAAVNGFLLFGEVPDLWTGVGAAVIFASTSYIAHREARRGTAHTPGGSAD